MIKHPFLVLLFTSLTITCLAQDDLKAKYGNLEVHDIVEEPPTFPGGMQAFYKYIQSNLKYPMDAIDSKVQGKVFVEFLIDEMGNTALPSITVGLSESCDKEALRLLNASPKWNPGKQNGKAVIVRMVLPITFKLE